jgi:hypothetical protein
MATVRVFLVPHIYGIKSVPSCKFEVSSSKFQVPSRKTKDQDFNSL